jgi:hypothetical protein
VQIAGSLLRQPIKTKQEVTKKQPRRNKEVTKEREEERSKDATSMANQSEVAGNGLDKYKSCPRLGCGDKQLDISNAYRLV